MDSKVRDEITYPFLNLNGWIAEVLERIIDSIPHFTVGVIIGPCGD